MLTISGSRSPATPRNGVDGAVATFARDSVTAKMTPLAEVKQLDEELATPSLSAMQQIDQALREATHTQAHSASHVVLQQFAGIYTCS